MMYAMVIKANTHAYSNTMPVGTAIAHMPTAEFSHATVSAQQQIYTCQHSVCLLVIASY